MAPEDPATLRRPRPHRQDGAGGLSLPRLRACGGPAPRDQLASVQYPPHPVSDLPGRQLERDLPSAAVRILYFEAENPGDAVSRCESSCLGSESVSTAVKELDNRITELFLGARSAQLTWEEWRSRRAELEAALEALISAIRREFRLPEFPIQLRLDPAPHPG